MKWKDLDRFSKFLFLLMAALAVGYLGREVWSLFLHSPADPSALRSRPSEPLPFADADVHQLLESGKETELLQLLHSPTNTVRDAATTALWILWRRAAGPTAELRLQAAMENMAKGQFIAAVDQLTRLVEDHPDFPEAFHQRATAYFHLEDFERAIQDCLRATELNKNHFGAWNGLGRCYLAIRRYDLALNAFERAIQIQPFSEDTRRWIEFCRERQRNLIPANLNHSAQLLHPDPFRTFARTIVQINVRRAGGYGEG